MRSDSVPESAKDITVHSEGARQKPLNLTICVRAFGGVSQGGMQNRPSLEFTHVGMVQLGQDEGFLLEGSESLLVHETVSHALDGDAFPV